MDLNFFRAIQTSIDSPSASETKRRKAIIGVRRDFMKSLDVDKFLIWKEQIKEDQERWLLIHKETFSTVIGHELKFTCLYDTEIETGNIIYNPKLETYYLVKYVNSKDYIYKSGILYRCNNILRWRDDNGYIWDYPVCDINSTQYNSGIEQGRNVDLAYSQHRLETTADINTVNLLIGKRFFMGKNTVVPEVYKLTQNDTSSGNYDTGTVSLTMSRDQYDERIDDKELRLCNYINSKIPTKDQASDIKLEFKGKPELRIGGRKTVTALSDNLITKWTIDTDSEDVLSSVAFVSLNGENNKGIITIKPNSSLVGKTFTLSYTDDIISGSQVFKIVGGI